MVVLVGLCAAFMTSLAWATASPVGSSPDEDAHITYAWGVATGQVLPWNAVESEGENGAQLVQVVIPAEIKERPAEECYMFQSTVPACTDLAEDPDTGTLLSTTYMARYPQLYYAAMGALMRVGLELGFGGLAVLVAARVFSGLLSLALIGWGTTMLARRFGTLPALVPALVTATPMLFFLSSSINPNGFEVASAIAVASGVLSVRFDAARMMTSSRGTTWGLGTAAICLAFARPASIVWLVLLMVVLVLPLGGRGMLSGLRGVGGVLTGALASVVAGGLAWFAYQNGTRGGGSADQDLSAWTEIKPLYRFFMVVLRFGPMLHEGYGLLGWLDTPLPLLFFLVWLIVSLIVVTRMLVHPGNDVLHLSWAIAFLAACVLVVGVQSNLSAFGWQGRYFLPALFAFVVLTVPAIAGGDSSRPERRWTVTALLVVVVGLDLSALVFNLFRYLYGLTDLYTRFSPLPVPAPGGEWNPVIGRFAPATVGAMGALLFVAILVPAICRGNVRGGMKGSPQRGEDLVASDAAATGACGTVRAEASGPGSERGGDLSGNGDTLGELPKVSTDARSAPDGVPSPASPDGETLQ